MNRIATQPYQIVPARKLAVNPRLASRSGWGLGATSFCLLHIPLAVLLYRFGLVSTLHALAVFGIGIWWALSGRRRLIHVAYVGAYITGAEVLWRMSGASVFWEFAKYGTAVIFLVAILRSGRLKGPTLMFAYFALLIPSIAVIIQRLGPSEARGYISFNLSGPFAMMVAAWFFSQIKLSVQHIQRIFLAAAAPVIGIATITFLGIYTAKDITFGSESNFASSGGFGPNQVSAALGLGALFALMFIILGETSAKLRILMLGAMLLMAVQSALTFSRGGLYNFAGSAAFASVYLLRDARMRRSLLFVAVLVFALGSYVILPRLEELTDGALGSRFRNTETTNRAQIVLDELRVWQEYPVLGVGPGGSKFVGVSTAHTEFGRLFAEHGTLGIVAFLLLLIAAAKSIRGAKTLKGRAIAVCMIGWSCLFMLNAAMRLVAPAFAFGLAFATVLPEYARGVAARPARRRKIRQLREVRRHPLPQQAVAVGALPRRG